jgi:hypothetical protein
MSPLYRIPSVTSMPEQTLEPLTNHDHAIFEELSFVRREAQAEADLAYEDWRKRATGDAYSVYRAAQDRADAAQDDLARFSLRLASG